MNNIEANIPRVPPVEKVAKMETITLKNLAKGVAEKHDRMKPQVNADDQASYVAVQQFALGENKDIGLLTDRIPALRLAWSFLVMRV